MHSYFSKRHGCCIAPRTICQHHGHQYHFQETGVSFALSTWEAQATLMQDMHPMVQGYCDL